MRSTLVFIILLFLACPAFAEEEEEPVPHEVSVTISPLHLLSPEFLLTGEFRLARKIGVAAFLGAGAVSEESKYYSICEIGGQFRFYLLGSFTHGMMLGADTGYVWLDPGVQNTMAYLGGVRAGPFVGYKIALRIGFTAEVQIGPVYVWQIARRSELQTLLNLKLGWSF